MNILNLWQNDRGFSGNIFKFLFCYENCHILNEILLMSVPLKAYQQEANMDFNHILESSSWPNIIWTKMV